MEQATDALKMAFAVLVFVIALSVSVNAFSEAKRTTDVLIENSDRETEYINLENAQEGSAYYNAEIDGSGNVKNTIRLVNVESIIPTIYRAYKENYKIVFTGNYFQSNNNWLYQKKDITNPSNTTGIPVYSIDLTNISIASGNQEEFLNGIMFGKLKKDGKMLDLKNNTVDGSYGTITNGVNTMTPQEYFKSTYQIVTLRKTII